MPTCPLTRARLLHGHGLGSFLSLTRRSETPKAFSVSSGWAHSPFCHRKKIFRNSVDERKKMFHRIPIEGTKPTSKNQKHIRQ